MYQHLYDVVGRLAVGPASVCELLELWPRVLTGTPVQRMLKWLQRERDSSSVAGVCSSPCALLPMHLPVRPVFKRPRSRRARRCQQARCSAWLAAEWLVTCYNYYELGSPKSPADYFRGLGSYRVTALQRAAFGGLVDQIVATCRCSASEGWTRGRKSLLDAIKSLSHVSPGAAADPLSLPAQAVDPDRISLPAKAGVTRPEDLLRPDRAAALKHYQDAVLPVSQWPSAPVSSCHWVSKADEPRLRRLLFGTGMVEALPAESVPRLHGRPLAAGLFTVPHKPESDRLIIDRRPANSIEKRLVWAHLPSGAQLAQFRLEPGQILRASGEDLSSYFYLLLNPEETRHRCAVGRPFWGEEEPDLGLPKGKKFYMALRVWAMGDQNSVDVAQLTHEDALARFGALRPDCMLRYGDPLPTGPVAQGIYIDDHIVFGIADRAAKRSSQDGPDVELMRRARGCYKALNWPTAEKKSFSGATRFTAWGTEVDGEGGWAGAAGGRRLQLLWLCGLVLSLNVVTRPLMESLVGSLVHPLGIRRELMCLLGRTFTWVHSLGPKRATRVPFDVRQELGLAALHLLVARADLRSPVSTKVFCSDATPETGGTVSAVVSRAMAAALYDHAEHRGRHTRLDWSSRVARLEAWDQRELPPVLAEAVRGAGWASEPTTKFRSSAHVNLQECRAVKLVLKQKVQETLAPQRVVCGTDSTVVLGAWAKGRSSSAKLNGVLRGCLGWQVLGKKKLVLFWLPSEENVADDPSREVPLRAPGEVGLDAAWLLEPEGTASRETAHGAYRPDLLVLEVFAGAGGLTAALARLGISTGVPIEAFPERGFRPEHDLRDERVFERLLALLRGGRYRYVHFGVPCSSWSCIQRINRGSRSRERPEGDESEVKILEANLLVYRVAALCDALASAGCFYSIENPDSSLLWLYPPMLRLPGAVDVKLDQCQYLLRPPHAAELPGDVRIKKPTRIRTNMSALAGLASKCESNHSHFVCLGHVRHQGKSVAVARAAGKYPELLTEKWASIVLEELQRGRRPGQGQDERVSGCTGRLAARCHR